MLKKGGRASIIVPEELLEAPTLASFREYLLKNARVTTVISLPKFAFAPYTKWKTYVIFIEKRMSPLHTIEEVIAKNEKIWAYIVDNDGYANSDKRFVTGLKDNNGMWLHNELQEYIDQNGVKQSSLIEQKYQAKAEDETQIYYNEWNEAIVGKKYGYIDIKDVVKKKTVKYPTLSTTAVNAILKNEANKRSILSDDAYGTLIGNISKGRNGYSVRKEHYIVDETIKDEFVDVFEELGISYDGENNKFFNMNREEVVYALPLIPEKYFRKKKCKEITLDELVASIDEIESELKKLLEEI